MVALCELGLGLVCWCFGLRFVYWLMLFWPVNSVVDFDLCLILVLLVCALLGCCLLALSFAIIWLDGLNNCLCLDGWWWAFLSLDVVVMGLHILLISWVC